MEDSLSICAPTRGVQEIDAVIETADGGIVAIEVKSANRHRLGDIRRIE